MFSLLDKELKQSNKKVSQSGQKDNLQGLEKGIKKARLERKMRHIKQTSNEGTDRQL